MNERLKIFVNYLKEQRKVVSDAEFARLTGKQRSFISEIISGKRTLSEQYVLKIADTFTELNKDWLITGNGEMVKATATPSADLDIYKKLIASLEDTVASQKLIIEKLQQEIEQLKNDSTVPEDYIDPLVAEAAMRILKKAVATPPDAENA